MRTYGGVVITDKLNKKDVLVLKHFIVSELNFLRTDSPFNSDKHYYAYPAKIAKDTLKTISGKHAGKVVCPKLEDLGFLSHDERVPPRKKDKVNHYYLNLNPDSLKEIVPILVGIAKNERDFSFFDRLYQLFEVNKEFKIDEDFVINVLRDKNIQISHIFNLCDWDEYDAEQIHKDNFNLVLKFHEKRKINLCEEECRLLPENLENMSGFDLTSFEKYIIESFETYNFSPVLFYATSVSEYALYPITFKFLLPVLNIKNEDDLRAKLNEVVNSNGELYKKFNFLRDKNSALLEYYLRWQRENVVLPVLSLISISPSALAEFLLFETYSVEQNFDSSNNFDELLHNLLFSAISDLIITKSYPINDHILGVELNSPIKKSVIEEINNDFRITPGKIINKSLLKIKFENQSLCLDSQEYYSSGYSSNGNRGKKYLDINYVYENGFCLDLKDILNFKKLIENLNNFNEPLVKNILGYSKIRTRNFLKYGADHQNFSQTFVIEVVDMINRFIIYETWSSKEIPDSIPEECRNNIVRWHKFLEKKEKIQPHIKKIRYFNLIYNRQIVNNLFGDAILKKD